MPFQLFLLSLSEMSIGEQKYTFSQKIMHKQNCS